MLAVVFEISEPTADPAPLFFSLLILSWQDVSCQLLLQGHFCLSAALLPAMMAMDSNSLKLYPLS